MKESLKKPWTSRDVMFKCFPKTPEEKLEAFEDALCTHYWKHRAHHSISSVGTRGVVTFTVGGHPWWVPKWWARRRVVDIAAKVGVGGDAVYIIERSVLDERDT